MAMHDPVRFANIVRGMVDIQRHEGQCDTRTTAVLTPNSITDRSLQDGFRNVEARLSSTTCKEEVVSFAHSTS